MKRHVIKVDAETYDALYQAIGECLRPGPKGRQCHKAIDHSGLHEGKDGSGTSLWGNDWKPNPSRTTYRTDF